AHHNVHVPRDRVQRLEVHRRRQPCTRSARGRSRRPGRAGVSRCAGPSGRRAARGRVLASGRNK
ncbi:hypothetical protein HDU67_003902, partial [Dinochytrium kinnereticum]